jgi:type II secretory pathway pseudopilin PulG
MTTSGIARREPALGFTLTELAIVLGVIGTVLASIWAAASTAYQHQNVARAQQQIITIVHNIRALHANHPFFLGTGDQTANLVSGGVFPSDMLVGSTKYNVGMGYTSLASNPWGGPVMVYETLNVGGVSQPAVFRVSYYNVAADACSQLAGAVIGSFTTSGPIQLITEAGGQVVNLANNPLDSIGIANYCSYNTGTAAYSVEFDFNL